MSAEKTVLCVALSSSFERDSRNAETLRIPFTIPFLDWTLLGIQLDCSHEILAEQLNIKVDSIVQMRAVIINVYYQYTELSYDSQT